MSGMVHTKRIFQIVQKVAASRKFLVFVLVLFVLQAGFLAFMVHVETPPDEKNQIEFIEYYANHSQGPVFSHQKPTFNLGDKTREVDYLYHYSMGWVMRAIPGPQTIAIHVIRLLSVVFALLTFLILRRLWKEFGVGDAAINVGLLTITNIPMVLMMSSAVNADVMVWLAFAAGFYFLHRFWKYHQPNDALVLLIIAVVGGLMKRTFFPLGLVIGVVTLVWIICYWHDIKTNLRWGSWHTIVLGILLVISAGLFTERVGGNLYHYHTLTPSCAQIQDKDACRNFWLNIRKRDFQNDKVAATKKWVGDSGSYDTQLKSPVEFVALWADDSYNNIVDIQTQGWRHAVTPPAWLGSTLLILSFVATLYGILYDVRRVRRDNTARWRLAFIGYSMIVIVSQLAVNYLSYERMHIFGLALNGRYLLPAIIGLSGLNIWYGYKLLGHKAGTIVAIVVMVAVIAGSGLIMMVRNPQLFNG